jgi:hypothetical protein
MGKILDGLWVNDLSEELRGKGADQVIAGTQATILRDYSLLRVRANEFSKVLNEVSRGKERPQQAYNNTVDASGIHGEIGNRIETLKDRVNAHVAAEGQKFGGSTVLDAMANATSTKIV